MPISSFEKAALLPKIYKIQLAVLLFLVVLDQLVHPLRLNFSEHLIERTLVLTFEFCFVNQVQVWTFSFIGLITWFNWKTHHNEMTMWFPKDRYWKPGSYILTLFWMRSLNQKNLKWNCFDFDMLLINEFYIKKYILCWLNKIMLGNPCTNF